ncbi:MAG: hypothetical protein S4CHLAM102_03530 [Chlamydiia bacterium]|nr:hypothetical protein [Chlamydiia bacterium]
MFTLVSLGVWFLFSLIKASRKRAKEAEEARRNVRRGVKVEEAARSGVRIPFPPQGAAVQDYLDEEPVVPSSVLEPPVVVNEEKGGRGRSHRVCKKELMRSYIIFGPRPYLD